jgi:predicted DNA-binding protein with PD1-like motif
MRFRLINESGEKTFALIFDKGDEIISELRRFATEQRAFASHFTAIEALNDVILGFFDPTAKEYKKIPVREQTEVLSLTGDITIHDGIPNIHAHVVVGKSDGTAYGGHLMEGHVFPTLELILVESPKYLTRRLDEETGLALIDLEAA